MQNCHSNLKTPQYEQIESQTPILVLNTKDICASYFTIVQVTLIQRNRVQNHLKRYIIRCFCLCFCNEVHIARHVLWLT